VWRSRCRAGRATSIEAMRYATNRSSHHLKFFSGEGIRHGVLIALSLGRCKPFAPLPSAIAVGHSRPGWASCGSSRVCNASLATVGHRRATCRDGPQPDSCGATKLFHRWRATSLDHFVGMGDQCTAQERQKGQRGFVSREDCQSSIFLVGSAPCSTRAWFSGSHRCDASFPPAPRGPLGRADAGLRVRELRSCHPI
jgi:hypothetical protein